MGGVFPPCCNTIGDRVDILVGEEPCEEGVGWPCGDLWECMSVLDWPGASFGKKF